MNRVTLPFILFIICLLSSCRPQYEIQKTEQSRYVLSDTSYSVTDSSVNAFISPYREKITETMKKVLAQSEFTMERGLPESRLGNFVSDACMSEATILLSSNGRSKPDVAVFNTGGLRRPLPEGNITVGDVFELMPFENELVILTMNGEHLKKIFNFIASKDGAPVSGVRFQINNKEAVNITVNNESIDPGKTYRVLTSDYLSNGNDGFDLFINVPRENLNLKVRDAIINYLERTGKEGKKISVNTDGRISHVQ